MSGKILVRLPPERRRARGDARLVASWLHRDGSVPALSQAPTLLSFVGTDFMDVFLKGIERTGSGWNKDLWGARVAYRDWSEPPKATRDLGGAARLSQTLQRRNLLNGELDARDIPGTLDPWDGATALDAALRDEDDRAGWLRKLYLPIHKQFTLITTELLCNAIGTPPIDPARVIEVGFVTRRLILDPNRERWEDWIAAPDGGGVWVELAGAGIDGVNPRSLPLGQDFAEGDETGLRARLGVTSVTAPLAVATVPLARVPASLGEAKRHTAYFGYLPLLTREMEKPVLRPEEEKAARRALAEEARRGLAVAFPPEKRSAWRARLNAILPSLYAWTAERTPSLVALVEGGPTLKSPVTKGPVLNYGDFDALTARQRKLLIVCLFNGLMSARIFLREALISRSATPSAPTLATLAGLAGDIQALGAAAQVSRHVWPPDLTPDQRMGWTLAWAIHTAGLELEEICSDFQEGLGAGGAGASAVEEFMTLKAADDFADKVFTTVSDSIKSFQHFGVDLESGAARTLLVFLGSTDLDTELESLEVQVREWFDPDGAHTATNTPALHAALRPRPPLPRFDPDHLYAVQCYARVAGPDRCDPVETVWSQRTEPFLIADHMDVLGLQPTTMRLPDIPKLIADIPRIAKARAMPMVAVTTPPDSAFSVGEEPKDTAREMGIAWICSFGIPVFTICAWIMFMFIFTILIALPGFAWMLLLKFCIPVPVPKRA